MTNTKVTRLSFNMLALTALCTLAACGGGGGGGGGGGTPTPNPPAPEQQSFSVSLGGIDVRRASNGEAVTVDTSSVSQNLTYED